MKKLMIAACAVAFAAVAQAGTINWFISGVTPTSGTSILADDYYTYCFIASDSSGQNTPFTTKQVVDWICAGTDPYDKGVEYGDFVTTSGQVNTSGDYTATGASAGTPISMHAYAVICDATDMEDIKHYQIVDCGTVNFTSSTQSLMANGTAASGNWVAIPEPTSGLLMLLGFAGLALRRRRA